MQGIETPELHIVLQQLVLPELSVAELGTLQCTSRALRDVVETADIALWHAAALPDFGLYHPALSSKTLGCLKTALQKSATMERHNIEHCKNAARNDVGASSTGQGPRQADAAGRISVKDSSRQTASAPDLRYSTSST